MSDRTPRAFWGLASTIAGVVGGISVAILLLPLMRKGSDGAGALLLLFVPFLVFAIIRTLGMIVGSIAQIFFRRRLRQAEIEPDVRAILDAPVSRIAVKRVSGSWRDIA